MCTRRVVKAIGQVVRASLRVIAATSRGPRTRRAAASSPSAPASRTPRSSLRPESVKRVRGSRAVPERRAVARGALFSF